MSLQRPVDREILAAAAKTLADDGYTVVLDPGRQFLPVSMHRLRPDAVAIGKSPNLLVEVAAVGPDSQRRVAEIQSLLAGEPGWKLHLVLNRVDEESHVRRASYDDIRQMLRQATDVSNVDTRAGLMLCWATLEALSRARQPKVFARPQTPARIVERLAQDGLLTAHEASFLRAMAKKRNAFVHGDLAQAVSAQEVAEFVSLLRNQFEMADA